MMKDLIRKILSEYNQPNNLFTELKMHVNTIKNLGDKTYKSFIEDKKGKLLLGGRFYVDTPDKKWVEDNINDLEFFRDNVVKNTPLHYRCNELINDCEFMYKFIDKVEEVNGKKTYSILNLINSNYTNWIKLIIDRFDLLQGETTEEKIKDFFSQKKISDLGLEGEEYKYIEPIANTLSFADLEILDASKNKNIDRFNKIVGNLKKTDESGQKNEKNFYHSLLLFYGIPKDNIRLFSSKGNLVDQEFQCDLVIFLNKKYIPVQVKSYKQNSKLLKYNIGGIVVFPTKYGWDYIKEWNQKEEPKSFSEFLNIY